MRFPPLCAATLLVIALGAATPQNLPPTVAGHLEDMASTCEEMDGKPSPGSALLHGRLTEDAEFWAIDEGGFQCDGALSLFSGSGGSQVSVFVRQSDGEVKRVFNHGGYGVEAERVGNATTLWLLVGGSLCGQPEGTTHADSISCYRRLVWNGKAKEMHFAPLSDARFPQPH